MCSLRLPESVFGPAGEDAVRSAICDVAERSFFAIADPCDSQQFAELAASHGDWLVATVRFHDGPCEGELSCTLPRPLAAQLYDAFTGRGPDEPLPTPGQIVDLVGELANMICGGWLTRAASHQTFNLAKPVVTSFPDGWARSAGDRGLTLMIDDGPMLVDVDVHAGPMSDRSEPTPAATGATA